MKQPPHKLAIRWGHYGMLMNFRVGLEVDGVEVAHTPFFPSDKLFNRKVKVLKKALGITGRVPQIGKWKNPVTKVNP